MAQDTALFGTEEAYFGATLTSDSIAFFGAAFVPSATNFLADMTASLTTSSMTKPMVTDNG